MKYLNMMRQSPKTRQLFKSTFNIDLKSSGPDCWFADWDHQNSKRGSVGKKELR